MHALRALLERQANPNKLESVQEKTPEERVEHARWLHFETGKEEIFASTFADVFGAALHGDLSTLRSIRGFVKTGINDFCKKGEGLLHFAARGRRAHIIRYLMEEGADVNTKNNLGWTAVHVAAAGDFGDIIRLLHQHGADLRAADNAGYTPAHIAASSDNVEALRALYECLKNDSSILAVKSNNGQYPTHVAAQFGHVGAVRFMAGGGADLSLVDNTGETAAHKAGRSGNMELVEVLASLGADLGALNTEGDTPLQLLYDDPRYA